MYVVERNALRILRCRNALANPYMNRDIQLLWLQGASRKEDPLDAELELPDILRVSREDHLE